MHKPQEKNVEPEPGATSSFLTHTYQTSFEVDAPRDVVWECLNLASSMQQRCIWPYRMVVFSVEQEPCSEFVEGGVCNHFGPLLSLPAYVAEVDPPYYRDLHYFYGSYAVSFSAIQPQRLELWVEKESKQTSRIKLKMESYTRRGWSGVWTVLQGIHWSLFARWLKRRVEGL